MKGAPKMILVVDDEQDVREIVAEIIAEMGFQVQSVDSGEEALNLMSKTPVDLVISDVKMDGMDGLSLARRIRDHFPHLPLALMTASPSDDLRRMLEERLFDSLLLKPFQMDELQGMVQNLTS